MDGLKDLVKLYDPSNQQPKELVSASLMLVLTLNQLGLPSGEYSRVVNLMKYSLPSGVVVYGSDGKLYKFKGGDIASDPTKDVYDSGGIGPHWVMFGGCHG